MRKLCLKDDSGYDILAMVNSQLVGVQMTLDMIDVQECLMVRLCLIISLSYELDDPDINTSIHSPTVMCNKSLCIFFSMLSMLFTLVCFGDP